MIKFGLNHLLTTYWHCLKLDFMTPCENKNKEFYQKKNGNNNDFNYETPNK